MSRSRHISNKSRIAASAPTSRYKISALYPQGRVRMIRRKDQTTFIHDALREILSTSFGGWNCHCPASLHLQQCHDLCLGLLSYRWYDHSGAIVLFQLFWVHTHGDHPDSHACPNSSDCNLWALVRASKPGPSQFLDIFMGQLPP